MAAPASGSISLGGLAFEKIEDEYDDGLPGTIDTSYGPFSLKDITIGGNGSGVGGETYEVTNAISPSHPDNDASYGMSEFYSYDHDFAAPGCNIAYYEGNNGEFNYPIDLGSAQGSVTIEYQAYSVPDRFKFTWNGTDYYSGTTTGNYDAWVGSQGSLASLRTVTGVATLEITSNSDTYGAVNTVDYQNGGRGSIYFNKNAATGIANMNVKAPIAGTAWWFSVSCPGQQVIVIDSNSKGIAPSITASNGQAVSTSIQFFGNVTDKGKTSNFTTAGTITAKGFAVIPNSNNLDNFLIGYANVVDVPENDSTINATGSFNESLAVTKGLCTSTVGTASSVSLTRFDISLNVQSVGARQNAWRAYASNAAGTTYTSVNNITNPGGAEQVGVVYCNQGYSATPAVSSSGNLAGSTGNQYHNLATGITTTGTRSGTVTENQVALSASNTYKVRGVSRQGTVRTYSTNITSFTCPAAADFTSTLTTGTAQYYSTYVHGYSVQYPFTEGSMSNTTFNTGTITQMHWMNSSSSTDYIYIVFSGTKKTWTAMTIGSYNAGASSTWTSSSSTTWRKAYTASSAANSPFGSNNTILTVTATY